MYLRWIDILQTFQRPIDYMAFKWFRVFHSETQLLLAHQLRLRGRWVSKKLIMEFAFNMERLAR